MGWNASGRYAWVICFIREPELGYLWMTKDRRMKTVTLRIPDDQHYLMLLEFLAKMGISPESASTQVSESDRVKMNDALSRLAASGGVAQIDDAAAWERDQRKDRPLR